MSSKFGMTCVVLLSMLELGAAESAAFTGLDIAMAMTQENPALMQKIREAQANGNLKEFLERLQQQMLQQQKPGQPNLRGNGLPAQTTVPPRCRRKGAAPVKVMNEILRFADAVLTPEINGTCGYQQDPGCSLTGC